MESLLVAAMKLYWCCKRLYTCTCKTLYISALGHRHNNEGNRRINKMCNDKDYVKGVCNTCDEVQEMWGRVIIKGCTCDGRHI